ncbi:MAG TPA: HPr family phosphocarrier protein [Candidatus Omnitrophota bacterium]|nr:HPr family phosphocarrier protein [Candidatus Omnitrophota bacterium]
MPKFGKEITIKSSQGLHARPAALFVQIANKYNSHVTIAKGEEKVNGKSIMGILTLGAERGSTLFIEVDGEDAQALLGELEELLTKESNIK